MYVSTYVAVFFLKKNFLRSRRNPRAPPPGGPADELDMLLVPDGQSVDENSVHWLFCQFDILPIRHSVNVILSLSILFMEILSMAILSTEFYIRPFCQ